MISDEVIALDVGGMSIRSGVVGLDHSVRNVTAAPVDHRSEADALVAAITQRIDSCRPRARSRIAIAIPGPFDHANGVSLMEHKFAALHGVDLRAAIKSRLPFPDLDLRFVNDAQAAGTGEVVAAGSPPGSTLVITLGTGMGTSLFDGSMPVPTRNTVEIADLWSMALPDGTLADDRFSATGLARALDVQPDQLPTATADEARAATIASWSAELGQFIDELRERLDLDLVILGGGVSAAFAAFAPAIASATPIAIRQAALGSSGPLLGAAVAAFSAD